MSKNVKAQNPTDRNEVNHGEFMKKAVALSREHMEKGHGGPFGAVIVKDGKIISEGWNQVTSANDPTAHAEVQAIRSACQSLNTFDLSGTEIYTSCEPCPMCLSAIYWARIEKIYYANSREDAARIQFDDDFIYQEIGRSIAERSIPMQQMQSAQAQQVFQDWLKKQDKTQH